MVLCYFLRQGSFFHNVSLYLDVFSQAKWNSDEYLYFDTGYRGQLEVDEAADSEWR